MLTLYVKTGCQYCAKVLAAGEEMNLKFNLKNVADPGIADELVAVGGKKQEPYLIDSETGLAMYEAKLIVSYLHEHYGTPAQIEKIDENPQPEAAGSCPV
jgi:glutathione S-transferase